jgi:hypothetical protein
LKIVQDEGLPPISSDEKQMLLATRCINRCLT